MRVNESFALEFLKKIYLEEDNPNFNIEFKTLIIPRQEKTTITSESGGVFFVYAPANIKVSSAQGILYLQSGKVHTQTRLHEGDITIESFDENHQQVVEYIKFSK